MVNGCQFSQSDARDLRLVSNLSFIIFSLIAADLFIFLNVILGDRVFDNRRQCDN
jgi:hypothetical protein